MKTKNYNKNNQYSKLTESDRFWEKVDKKSDVECWNWMAFRKKFGHGQMYFRGSYHVASRVSWILNKSEIPNGLNVLHKCDNPSCVNPNHLYLGTQKENARDMTDRNRRFQPETKGSNNAMAKITGSNVKEIRNLYKNKKFTQKEIAKKFNITHQQVHNIVKNKQWNHIK